ncbi:MAG: metallopeptidase [Rubripirellula sp.]|nr:metallopeptidase [Rubripirellula sp.]
MKPLSCFLLLTFASAAVPTPATAETAETADRIEKNIEGWRVSVDPKILSAENADIGNEALKALANHLQRVRYIVHEDRVRQLQKLPIWIDWDHKLGNMQYHPSRGWLEKNGHDPRLTKHVHVPRAKQLLSRSQWAKHPYVILHELAHAYHDQVMGFDQPEVITAFQAAQSAGLYEDVLLFTGRRVKHYALTNHKEYFAESTEAYFGVNDFFPFVRAELKEYDPRTHQLMEDIWGKIP